jgi:DNA-binding GntR family transcriptional regulator
MKHNGRTRVGSVYGGLSAAIFARDLPPGTKLSEDTLGNVFGVSRTVVRAALNRLHGEQVVELRPNRGAFVASPSIEEARQVFEARLFIEQQTAAKLAKCITPQQLRQLAKLLDDEHRAVRDGDRARSIRLSGEFHLEMVRMAGNEVLAGILSGLITRSSLVMALHARPGEAECGHAEHAELLAALKSGDGKRSASAMTRHLEAIVTRTALSEPVPTTRSLNEILSAYR